MTDEAQSIFEQIANGEANDSYLYDAQIYGVDNELEGRPIEDIVQESQRISAYVSDEEYNSENDDEEYNSENDDEDYRPPSSKKRKPATSVRSQSYKEHTDTFDAPLLSLEEQQEIEEPIEIDLRDVWKKYGINPIEHELAKRRKKNTKKLQDSDIVELSIGESRYKRASGRPEEAERLLYEVIRSHPLSAKLYGALGEMYDLAEDYEKALEFYLIAAELGKKDSQSWEKSAEVANKLELYKSALNFYSRASKLEPKKGTYYLKRCTLLENSLRHYTESVKVLERYLSVLQAEGVSESANVRMMLNVVFRIAKLLINNLHKCKQALKFVERFLADFSIENNPELRKIFTCQHIDLYFEVLLKNKLYEKFLRKCFEYGYFKVPGKDQNIHNHKMEALLEIVAKLNIDTRDFSRDNRRLHDAVLSKVIVCLIQLKKFDKKTQDKVNKLTELDDSFNIQRVFPMLLESLIKESNYHSAQKLSFKLIQVFPLDSHYLYLHGLCLSRLEQSQEAMDYLEKAIQIDKNNYDAIHELSLLCNKSGDPQRALRNVSWQVDTDFDDKQLYNRCRLLYSCKRWTDFVEAAQSLLEHEMVLFQTWNQIDEVVRMPMIPNVQGLSAKCRRARRKICKKKPNPKMNAEQFFDLWKKTVFVMFYYTKQREQALKYAFSGLLSSHFNKVEIPTIVCILRFCIDVKFEHFTYEWCTYLLKMYPRSGKMWYAFSVVMNDIYGNFRHKRFSMRLWKSLSNGPNSTESVNVLLMNGIIALLNGRYKIALAIFLAIYRMRESHQEFRYDSFFIALSYLHLLMQHHNTNRCSLFAQMIAFFDDYARSGLCQETYYNLGRAFHQLGFIQHAVGFYHCALNTPSKVFDKRFDLEPEIAFNLSQIYKSIGRQARANQLLLKYCSV